MEAQACGLTGERPVFVSSRGMERVIIPRDYSLGPVFAAIRQSGAREVTINERRYQIGGFHPMRPELHPPALDVRHARALFALLSFRRPDVDSPVISFSFNELCRKYAHSNGGRYSREIRNIVADLIDSYIRITELASGSIHEYRLIERIDIEKRYPRRRDSLAARSRQREIFFHGCTLSPEFYAILNRVTELQHLILDVFTSIRSPLAQSIYLYIPSRAHHHTEDDPFEISISKLLEQVSFPIPNQKNRRRQLFTQNRKSIIQQLDGLETLKGIFRVRLAETSDGTDWKLQTWVEKHSRKLQRDEKNSKLMTIFLASGRTQEELDYRLDNMESLTDYEIGLLQTAEINVEKDRRFLELAKALVGPVRFVGIVGECKADTLEGRKATKNPTARLIWRIKEALPEKPAALPNHLSLKDGGQLRDILAGGNSGL
jgi:hypothetical protein